MRIELQAAEKCLQPEWTVTWEKNKFIDYSVRNVNILQPHSRYTSSYRSQVDKRLFAVILIKLSRHQKLLNSKKTTQ